MAIFVQCRHLLRCKEGLTQGSGDREVMGSEFASGPPERVHVSRLPYTVGSLLRFATHELSLVLFLIHRLKVKIILVSNIWSNFTRMF